MMEESRTIANMAGWIPAVVFPGATGLQLIKILQRKSASGVSAITWLAFGVANVAAYLYAEKYASLQAIVGFLGTALLDFVIVALVILYGRIVKSGNDALPR